MERSAHKSKQRFNEQNKLTISSYHYKSSEKEWHKTADQEAKIYLESYPHKQVLISSVKWKTLACNDSLDGVIRCYLAGNPDSIFHVRLMKGDRRPCVDQNRMGYKCYHKLCRDKLFIWSKFHHRQWQTHIYEKKHTLPNVNNTFSTSTHENDTTIHIAVTLPPAACYEDIEYSKNDMLATPSSRNLALRQEFDILAKLCKDKK